MWTFRFHSGLSAFSSSDINKIVSILSNAASASKIYWNNNICIKCTHLPFTEITVFQIFSIQILKLISDTMELFCVIYGNEEQDGSKLQNVKHSSSQNNSRTLLLQQRALSRNLILGVFICSYCCMKQGESLPFPLFPFARKDKLCLYFFSKLSVEECPLRWLLLTSLITSSWFLPLEM